MTSSNPTASSSGSHAASSAESATVRSMSITGLAASPGTDVDPTCSTASARGPSAVRMRSASTSKRSGQEGSGSTTSIPVRGDFPGSQAEAPPDTSSSSW